MEVIGITSGIGSLQYGFRLSGFNVLHSHEWRPYYMTGTYETNYGYELIPEYDPIRRWIGVDIIVSHTECGNYSNLYTGKNRDSRSVDPGDIWKAIDLIKLYIPKVFLMDNLPKSLLAIKKDDWASSLPDYNISFEWVSNFGYGNIQKNRNRLFIIGVHKDLFFKFTPVERIHDSKLSDCIGNISDGVDSHIKMPLDQFVNGWNKTWINADHNGNGNVKLSDMQDFLSRSGFKNFIYKNSCGEFKQRPGYSVLNLDRYSPVLTGGGAAALDNFYIHDPELGYIRPLTIRERARIQGFGDDFLFIPSIHHFHDEFKLYNSLIKQTGKCMPVQFPMEFARQLSYYLQTNKNMELTPSHIIKRNKLIETDYQLKLDLCAEY